MEQAFQQCVTEVAGRGAAVLLSSHILAEVEKLCDDVTIIRSGRTVRSGTLAELRHLMRTTVTVRTHSDGRVLRDVPYVHDFDCRDGQLRFSVDRTDLEFVMEHLIDLGIDDLTVTPASLEDMFLRSIREPSRDHRRRRPGTSGAAARPGAPGRLDRGADVDDGVRTQHHPYDVSR